MPTIVRWPGRVPAGTESDHPSQFHDWMATLADLGGVRAPFRTDGVSLLPTLLGKGRQEPGRVYVEYSAKQSQSKKTTPGYKDFRASRRGAVRGDQQMIYLGRYKGLRTNIQSHGDSFQIYDTLKDPAERQDLKETPEGRKLQQCMRDAVLRMRRVYDYTHPKRGTFAQRPYDTEFVPALREDEMPPNLVALKADTAAGRTQQDGTLLRKLYLRVPEDGSYRFYLKTPAVKGAKAFVRLHDMHLLDADFNYVPGKKVSSSMGEHTTENDPAQTGKKALLLQRGIHPPTIQTEGFSQFPELFWQKNDGPEQKIPSGALLVPEP